MGSTTEPLPVMPHPALERTSKLTTNKVMTSKMPPSSSPIMEQSALGDLQEDEEVWLQDNAPRRFVTHEGYCSTDMSPDISYGSMEHIQ
jgi:hypothetical protein